MNAVWMAGRSHQGRARRGPAGSPPPGCWAFSECVSMAIRHLFSGRTCVGGHFTGGRSGLVGVVLVAVEASARAGQAGFVVELGQPGDLIRVVEKGVAREGSG